MPNLLAKNGHTRVWNIVDGMEGGQVKDPDSVFDGMRMKNGWKNSACRGPTNSSVSGWCCRSARVGDGRPNVIVSLVSHVLEGDKVAVPLALTDWLSTDRRLHDSVDTAIVRVYYSPSALTSALTGGWRRPRIWPSPSTMSL